MSSFPALSDEEGWGGIINGMSAAFILTDLEFRVIRWNPAAERLYGFRTRDVLGRSVYDLWIPQWESGIGELNQRLLRGESWTGNLWMQRGDGSYVLARGTRAAVVDSSNRIVGLYAITYDAYAVEPAVDRHTPETEPPPSGPGAGQRITVFPASRMAFVDSNQLVLTATELALLELLTAARNQVVPADELAEVVWGYPTNGDRGFLQAHISRLRAKLRAAGANDPIEAVRGIGYRLRD